MKTKRDFRDWRRRFRQLAEEMPRLFDRCWREGDAEQVHQLRVGLRRLRLYVRLGRPQYKRKVVVRFRRWARQVSKLTSPVRDLDVALEWLATHQDTGAVAGAWEQRRSRVWAAARGQMKPVPREVFAPLGDVRGGVRWREEIEARFGRLVGRFRREVERLLPCFFELDGEAQHGFRRTLRWWRYCRELEVESEVQVSDGLLAALVALQERTGTRQNLGLVLGALRGLRGAGVARMRREVGKEMRAMEAEIRRVQSAECRVQNAEGRMQRAEGRGQRAEGRGQRAE